jgi:hypothetical protein
LSGVNNSIVRLNLLPSAATKLRLPGFQNTVAELAVAEIVPTKFPVKL